MESTTHFRTQRARANGAHHDNSGTGRRAHHKHKQWVADNATNRNSTSHGGADTERWERGGHRGSRGRGRGTRGKFPNTTLTFRQGGAGSAAASEGDNSEMEDATDVDVDEVEHQEPDTLEERERFWKELVKAREVERKTAIAEGKMDDPNVAKRLEDAITMVGTCMDMCPTFERYRRERENNLFEWEIVPGTKRVDHKRAVKMYERAAGDKTLPSDLRPPKVLQRTLDYLFHDLLPRGGFSATFNFIRDRSRAVRSDFTMQHEMGSIAIECHDRCARFHILGLHLERDRPGSQVSLEEQQLKYTLQSLKEFYEEQRGKYQSPTELEMRVYHRLIHIRDQKERQEDIPSFILEHPVFKLTTKFRLLVQAKSAPIGRSSPLSVDNEALGVFNELIIVLQGEGNYAMIYLVACIIEHLFGTDTVDDIESLRENLTLSDIIDGSSAVVDEHHDTIVEEPDAMHEEEEPPFEADLVDAPQSSPKPPQRSGTEWLNDTFGPKPTESAFLNPSPQPASQSPKSAFSNLTSVPNVFGTTTFQPSAFGSTNEFGFGSAAVSTSVFGSSATQTSSFNEAPSSGQPPVFSQPPLVLSPTLTVPSENKAQVPFTVPPAPPPSTSNQPLPPFPKLFSIPEVNKAQPLNPHAPVFAPVLSPIVTQPTPSYELPTPPSPVTSQPTFDVRHNSFGSLDQTPPSQPPPLSRQQPISLPSTPTATMYIPSTISGTSTKSVFQSLKKLQPTLLTASPTEILSPLVLSSPGTRSTLSSMASLHRRDSVQTPLRSGITAANLEAVSSKLESPVNGKAPALSSTSNVDQETLESKALAFARRNLIIKEAFQEWRERTANRTKWKEACLRSEAYSQRVHTERLSKSTSSLPQENKRKVVTPERPSPVRKRLRHRLSSEYRPPPSDEELLKRFEKNREENERRWARGSFFHVLQQHLKDHSWSAWLSLNQDNDGTAIWLELKFDVPDSGNWKDANIFQIPVVPQPHSNEALYPGIIIFERTPIGEVEDPLERKYRMLDDCSRLRDIIESLPPDRHFIPSLLTICWSGEEPDSSSDFNDMIAAILHDEISSSYVNLSLTSTASDLDSRFQSALQSLKVDTEGKLVRWMFVPDLFRLWKPIWQTFTSQRLEQCIVDGEFDWGFLGRFLELCIDVLITISSAALQLMGGNTTIFENILPNLKLQHVRDSDSMFDAVLQWLDNSSLQYPGRHLAGDLRLHQALDREFPSRTFVQYIYDVAQELSTQHLSPKAANPTLIRKTRLDAATLKISTEQGSYSDELNALRSVKLRQTYKRTASINASSSRSSTPAKRRRLSASDGFSEGGSPPLSITSPAYTSPSFSTTTSLPPEDKSTVVTSAMLRALTRDIRTKFGSPR
ncbi:SAC3/GANP/Nin1/mts3/eIF-3 p25 family-domain-containing protein [Suillus fuscotomentosus]|uniref:SAC3/GANP/Nin1/mts3/eIF-3 p25 family-domain-containing protein n=1 Tax=Suillus fuscotomentosus TaxID=1912939 RepID=A0AAD4DT92_9AGAM|nr:SAC3/GANP/Nin1/mts3/eIF-3 p25 family-domain-containing protein [Suillus fuscotomentosus]KAG1893364.1 SAC3/GANP/Nin1/mts3/eIF-3 p25 family-domain-containing protein [Suillus fuscotomentosus]